MSKNRSITRLASITFIGKLIGRPLHYLMYIVIGRFLGADALGSFSIGIVVILIFGGVARLGCSMAALRFVPDITTEESESEITGLILTLLAIPIIAGSFISFVTIANFDLIVGIISAIEGESIQVIFIGVPIFGFLTVTESIAKGYKETKYAVYIRDVGLYGFGFLFVFSGVLIHQSIVSVYIAYLLAMVAASIIGIISLNKLGAFSGIFSPNWKHRKVLSYSMPITIVDISKNLISWTDIIVLGIYVTTTAIGFYESAYQTAVLVMFAYSALNSIFPSIASELYAQQQYRRLGTIYAGVTKWVTHLSILSGGYIIIFSNEILGVFGSGFSEASLSLLFLCIGTVMSSTSGPSGYLLLMADNERVEAVNVFISAGLNIALNLYLVPRMGIIGAAIATCISMSFLAIIRIVEVIFILDLNPINQNYASFVPGLCLTMASMFFISNLSIGDYIGLFIGAIIAGGVLIIYVWIMEFSEYDRALLEAAH